MAKAEAAQSKIRFRELIAWALGLSGLIIPAILLRAFIVEPSNVAGVMSVLMVAYCGAILAFLGGVRWGAAFHGEKGPDPWALLVGVVPTAIGFAALAAFVLSPAFSPVPYIILIGGFVAQLMFDAAAKDLSNLAPWYRGLRTFLSAALILALTASAYTLMRKGG